MSQPHPKCLALRPLVPSILGNLGDFQQRFYHPRLHPSTPLRVQSLVSSWLSGVEASGRLFPRNHLKTNSRKHSTSIHHASLIFSPNRETIVSQLPFRRLRNQHIIPILRQNSRNSRIKIIRRNIIILRQHFQIRLL
jgi:hypothetical protein